MPEIRTIGGSVIATADEQYVRRNSLWGNDVMVAFDSNDIRRDSPGGELIATIHGNDITSAFGSRLLAVINNSEIRSPFFGELWYQFDGQANNKQKAGLAIGAMILDRRL